MHNGADNRLTAEYIRTCLQVALDIVERDWRSVEGAAGALIISGGKNQEKFFSNGLDYENAVKDPGFMTNTFHPFLARLLSFPIPTVAAINGHAFAGGFLLALVCDYRVMTSGRAWCSMNEIHFGAPFTQALTAILNYKLPTPQVIRKTVLEGHRWTPTELLEIGVVDQAVSGSTNGVLDAAFALAEARAPLAKTGVWGLMKKDLMRGIMDAAGKDGRLVYPVEEAALAKVRLRL